MNKTKRILTRGWSGTALSILTFGYYDSEASGTTIDEVVSVLAQTTVDGSNLAVRRNLTGALTLVSTASSAGIGCFYGLNGALLTQSAATGNSLVIRRSVAGNLTSSSLTNAATLYSLYRITGALLAQSAMTGGNLAARRNLTGGLTPASLTNAVSLNSLHGLISALLAQTTVSGSNVTVQRDITGVLPLSSTTSSATIGLLYRLIADLLAQALTGGNAVIVQYAFIGDVTPVSITNSIALGFRRTLELLLLTHSDVATSGLSVSRRVAFTRNAGSVTPTGVLYKLIALGYASQIDSLDSDGRLSIVRILGGSDIICSSLTPDQGGITILRLLVAMMDAISNWHSVSMDRANGRVRIRFHVLTPAVEVDLPTYLPDIHLVHVDDVVQGQVRIRFHVN